ncbi:hypothetical protein HNY73_015320 [Argiope bruennichi]|uniref:Uncharacterized protein n=1 Tax=Argiope bruennichi TaxID=94029 RepID=A0A8T0ES99_ARGBR|nr:hypothetical protein HNY73_015320 [Argiope bruennichi]
MGQARSASGSASHDSIRDECASVERVCQNTKGRKEGQGEARRNKGDKRKESNTRRQRMQEARRASKGGRGNIWSRIGGKRQQSEKRVGQEAR